jgi:lysophospholipase L1-like esterase
MSNRLILKKIFSITLGCCIGLFLAETVTRILLPTPHPSIDLLRPVLNDAIAFEYIPNVEIGNIKINSSGFRDDPFPLQKDVSEVRILWLGDSIVMGWGVAKEERFTDILNIKLKEQNSRIRTINMAVESYSNYQELLVLQRKGIAVNPDVVILGFCWNDILKYEHFVDSSGINRFVLKKDSYNNEYVNLSSKRIYQYLFKYSRLLDLGRISIHKLVHVLYRSENKEKDKPTFSEFLDWYLSVWESQQLDTLKAQILTMKNIVSDIKAKFIIVTIPLSIQVDKDLKYEKYLARIDNTQEKFRQYCELHNIDVYDLKPGLLQMSKTGNRKLFLDVWHLNKTGNEIAADLIYSDLKKKNLF